MSTVYCLNWRLVLFYGEPATPAQRDLRFKEIAVTHELLIHDEKGAQTVLVICVPATAEVVRARTSEDQAKSDHAKAYILTSCLHCPVLVAYSPFLRLLL